MFCLEITSPDGDCHKVPDLPSMDSCIQEMQNYLAVAATHGWWLPLAVVRDEAGNTANLAFRPTQSGWEVKAVPPVPSNAIIVWHPDNAPEELRMETDDVNLIIEVPPSQFDSYFLSRADVFDSCHDLKIYPHPTKTGWRLVIATH